MGQAQINVRTRACSRTSIARTKQAALTHNVRGKELTTEQSSLAHHIMHRFSFIQLSEENIIESKGPFTLGVISAGYRAARYFTAGCCVYIRRYSGGK